jgi:hypothetical protein
MRLLPLPAAVALATLAAPGLLTGQSSPADRTPSAAAAPAVRFTGYLQARETYRAGTGLSGSINRARLTAYGTAAKDLAWRVQGEFRTGSVGTGKASVSLQDAYLRYRRGHLGLQVGQFKTPFSQEFIRSLADVETADRATVIDSVAPKRDLGLMADYAIGALATVTAGVFNGDGQNVTANADSILLWVGRATIRPVAYLTLGANVASYQSDSTRYGVDASLEYLGGSLRGEYLGQHRAGGGLDDKGWYLQAAYRLLPWVQLVAKQEDFRRSAVSDALRNRATTAGANVEFNGGKVRLLADYVSRKIGVPGVRRGQLVTQAQVRF